MVHSSDLDQRKCYSIGEDSPPGEWDKIAELMMFKFGESGPSLPSHESIVQRSAQEQRWWNITDTPLRRFGND